LFAVSQVILYLWGENKNKYMGKVVHTVWSYCNSVVDPGIQWGWGLCVPFHSPRTTLTVPLDHYKYPPRSCHSYKPQFVAFEKFCVLWLKIEVYMKVFMLLWSDQYKCGYNTKHLWHSQEALHSKAICSYCSDAGHECKWYEWRNPRN
jgi:hypothetical protein